MIDQINITIFSAINKYAGEIPLLDGIAIALAEYSPYVFIAVLLYLWFFSRSDGKYSALVAGYSTITGVLINRIITSFYFHPRPFMRNIGTNLVYHVSESSIPSDHTTFMLSIAAMLIFIRSTRRMGWLLFLFGFLSGVARVFCGVHFPGDIFFSVLVSFIAASIIWALRKKLSVINNIIVNVYFSILIRKKLYTRIDHSTESIEKENTVN